MCQFTSIVGSFIRKAPTKKSNFLEDEQSIVLSIVSKVSLGH